MQFSDIKGLGKTRIAKLNEAGIYTPADLLTLFPYKYVFDDCLVSDFEDGKEARVVAKLVGLPKVVRLPAKRCIVSAKMLCGGSELEFFHIIVLLSVPAAFFQSLRRKKQK